MSSDSADEFETIKRLFAPLATSADARGLADDAALIDGRHVVTTDAIVEGVHFLSDDPIATVAMKALRVNVSDLIAKGAQPRAALLTLIWPNARPAEQIELFAESFGGDLAYFGMTLLGGDTTSTAGPLTISVTAFGEPLSERTPSRADAKIGDDVWLVGGEIGSAWLGLQLRTGAMALEEVTRGRDEQEARVNTAALAGQTPDYLTLPGKPFDAEAAWLMSTYLAPFVRPECADIVSRYANASMDVSDGLVGDAGKLAAASGAALKIEANAIPFSIPAERWAFSGGDFRKLITAGDDYVVLFTAPAAARAELESLPGAGALRLTRIGAVEAGEGVQVVNRQGDVIPIPAPSYAHKLGR
ncbi:MAG TPA: thiamine-phosphate kinase [Vitreimonas sp.]|uniref:thiamine-phosphate kinase n=1 Tax=Vitreimonas sp. TaxID=3069702 RepID=UPI002D5CAE65|nr:thiamine-phosphate kinase [Vitreimonas sp.]HYD85931.1 thiamine-phosphate kinase [Vitreimonas sp.]